MKRNFLLLAILSGMSFGVSAQSASVETADVVKFEAGNCHTEHDGGKPCGMTFRLKDRSKVSRALDESQDVKYSEPANLFTMGYTPNLSYYSRVARRGAAYKPQTWVNISDGLSQSGATFQWTYDSPKGPGQGEMLVYSKENNLTVSYPFNNGWWSSPVLTANLIGVDIAYSPQTIYRFGGRSAISFPEGVLDFGMTPYSEMLYRDANGKRTTTFGSLKYLPTAADPNSVAKWTTVLPDNKGLKMKGFYNIFHEPDAPYVITRIWGWIEYTALKETELTMRLYKMDGAGKPTEEVIAEGKMMVSPGSDKSLLFDLYKPGKEGVSAPITIDCAFMAVLEGFAEKGAFSKVLPILGSGTVWEGDGECPWAHNCGVLLSWDEGGVEKQDYFFDSKVYDEGRGSTKKLCACDFLWMVDGGFPYISEKTGVDAVALPLEGGSKNIEFETYWALNDPNIKISTDADWIEFTSEAAIDSDFESILTVSALPAGSPREGHILISGPAVDYTLTVRQTESSGVEDVVSGNMVVKTEYFDITGRKLREKPEAGLFMRVETYANGNKKTIKQLK